AGVAALAAEIHASPVSRAPTLLSSPRLKEALGPKPEPEGKPPKGAEPEKLDLNTVFVEAANSMLLNEYPQMTVGILDKDGKVLTASGVADELITDVADLPAVVNGDKNKEDQFAATLGSKLQVVKVSRADEAGNRLVAIQELNMGAGSFLRTVLGTDNPAGIVRDGVLVGSAIGDQPVEELLTTLAKTSAGDTPRTGASEVHSVGDGLNARIGAIGRVPGPAGAGENATYLVVLSANTAAAGQTDLATALGAAKDNGMLDNLNWPLLFGLLAVSLGLAFYLPFLEAIGPLKRLTAEFRAMLQGTQQQLFYDTYSGPIGELAQAAVAYHETLRANLQSAELDGETGGSGTRSHRRLGGTRSHRRVGRTGGQQRVPQQEGPMEATPGAAPDPEDMPTMAHQAVGRGPGFFTMPASKPLRSRETVIGNLMTMDDQNDETPSSKDDAEREAYYQNVFEEFIKFKVENNEPIDNFTYEKFAQKLRGNTANLMKRPDVKDVQFSVYLKDGKVALKARVVRG
ncbi:MAG: hypothetical protein KC636_21390, partial [Myxococcales bacterium]|nr:hypothetical protein [Myxococcales bacterium]